ncbi:MAG: hypothetical protein ACREON_05040, partial [Gemmatimonadaceae bacterium]
MDELRYDVPSAERLAELARAPLPPWLRAGSARRWPHRDLYLDTTDGTLRARGMVCRLRLAADRRPVLALRIDALRTDGQPARARARRVVAGVRAADPRAALREDTPVTRWLRALVEPERLDVCADLEVDRWVRTALADWLGRAGLELHYDRVTARHGELVRTFQHLCAHRVRCAGTELERLAELLQHELGLRPVAADRRERAESLLKWGHAGSARSSEIAGEGRRAAASGAAA